MPKYMAFNTKIWKNYGETGANENNSVLNKNTMNDLENRIAFEFENVNNEFENIINEQKILENNGYQQLPSGLILQWGVSDITLTSTEIVKEITFLKPFSKMCFQVNATLNDVGALNTILTSNVACNAFSRTGASLQVKSTSNYAKDKTIKAYWFAIGQ